RLRADDREAANHALEFVKKTIELMGFETATVTADEDVEHVEIAAPEGDDSLIIGRHGETLSALTYLAETCARAEKCHVNIVVDCNGYRARRAASLTAMAKRRARESASKHRRIKLEPMDRTDRRTVHCALADDEYVTTASEGKEPYRYIVITPKDGVREDYDDNRHDRRDRRGKGRDRGGRSEAAPTGEKPRRAAFDINIHGFVGHNDPTTEDSDNEAPTKENTEE
ncbi:MAG: KH domain-containing protein, partial [Clostridiales bacterium]|nr:KH domain-containing protein [Clostridiales bacterium]